MFRMLARVFLLLLVIEVKPGWSRGIKGHSKQVQTSQQRFSTISSRREAENTAHFWYQENLLRLNYVYETSSVPNNLPPELAKNIIFFLGDGMGVSTVTTARIYKGQKKGQSGEEEVMEFEKFPYLSLSKTYCLDKQTSDSSSTATAYLCGVKGNYETVGVTGNVKLKDCQAQMNRSNHVTSILQWAQEAGKSTGFVTTTRITHASPSGLYAHSASRDWESEAPEGCEDIAYQLIHSSPGRDIQVIMGGGRRAFLPAEEPDIEHSEKKGLRKDGRNLVDDWESDKVIRKKSQQHKFIWNKEQFDKVDPQDTEYLLGMFEYDHMNYELDRDPKNEPSITEMTRKAIEILRKNPKGFFLFVEGGRIDLAHHVNLAHYALEETVAMDQAVAAAVEMVDLSETIILVTADHSHGFIINGYPDRGHNVLGIGGVSDIDNRTYTTLLYGNGPGYTGSRRKNLTEDDVSRKNYSQDAVFPMQYANHGGEDVPVYAIGPRSYMFRGIHEQSYIPFALSYAACIGPVKHLCNAASTLFVANHVMHSSVTLWIHCISVLLLWRYFSVE